MATITDLNAYRREAYLVAEEVTDEQVVTEEVLVDPTPTAPHVHSMTDIPTRGEIDAKLQAAEARTETRYVELRADMDQRFMQMRADMDTRFTRLESKFDTLLGAVQGWGEEMRETRKAVVSENKTTRSTMIVTGLASVLAVLALVVTLWAAGLSVQANMLSSFQSGLSAVSTAITAKPPQQ